MRKFLTTLLAPLALLASGLFVFGVVWGALGGVADAVSGFAWLLTWIAAVVAVFLWILAWRFRRPTGEVGTAVGESGGPKVVGFTYKR